MVVPTYNERSNVAPLVKRIKDLGLKDIHVLFVDDSSPDGTADEVRLAMKEWPHVHLMVREGKKGIGSAHLEGFTRAIEEFSPDVVVEMDADLQHPPEKVPELVSAVEKGADVAVASRRVSGGGTEGWSLWRRWVSSGANLLTRLVLGLDVKDSTSGFRALSLRAAKAVVETAPESKDYFFQVESLYALKMKGMKMVEVPFIFQSRRSGRSKMGMGEVIAFFLGVWRLRLMGT